MNFILNEDVTYNQFKSKCNKTIKTIINGLNSFLKPFDFLVEYIDDYFEEGDEHSEEWIGVFCNDIQTDLRVFPVSINLPMLYRFMIEERGSFNWVEIDYHLEKTLAHEVGHGIYQYIIDFKGIEGDEEDIVEDFASYYIGEASDCELMELLNGI